ncbi:MAG TPA: sulfatase-like hydrolase/transferase [Opitutaceae bacterium]|nr:sulfatase-like hydrolase/transferase [Opitutaceae bacterium]
MNKFRFLSALFLLLALAAHAAPPNIVILLADDLGHGDLSSYGAPEIRTPHIDSIGKNGVRFTRFYSNSPECTPSRTALLTGRHPQRVGGLECAIGVGNVGRYDEAIWLQQRGELGLPATEASLAPACKRAGYATALFGKWHLGYESKFSPRQHGFDEALYVLGGAIDYITHKEDNGDDVLRHNGEPVTVAGHLTDIIADRALAWLKERGDAPYLLYLPFTAPHFPYQLPGDPAVTGSWSKGTKDTYRGMIEHMDRRIGEILRAIAASPRARDTIVVFLSDNGGTAMGSNQPFRGHKTTMWEGGIHVPCLVQWPAVIRAGTELTLPVQTIDLTATLLAAAAVSPSATRPLDGESFLGVWRGQAAPRARPLYWRYQRETNRRKAILDGEYKLVIDNGARELIHLAKDPQERTNLLASLPEKAAALEAKLAAWEREVRAPRLREFYAQPASAK